MSLVVTVVTVPPVIDTLTTSVVPWTISPLLGESRVIFTGVGGRWPRPPLGVGYGVGAGVPELPSAVAELQAVMQTSIVVRTARSGRRMVVCPPPPAARPQRVPSTLAESCSGGGDCQRMR